MRHVENSVMYMVDVMCIYETWYLLYFIYEIHIPRKNSIDMKIWKLCLWKLYKICKKSEGSENFRRRRGKGRRTVSPAAVGIRTWCFQGEGTGEVPTELVCSRDCLSSFRISITGIEETGICRRVGSDLLLRYPKEKIGWLSRRRGFGACLGYSKFWTR